MKKFLSALLVLVMVCSFGVSAFATSPAAAPVAEDGETTAALPEVETENVLVTKEDGTTEEVLGFAICDEATDEVDGVLPAEDAEFVAVADAEDKLSEEDAAKFLEEYEKVKAITDKAVKYFFWFKAPEDTLKEGEYLKFIFTCKGENVGCTVDGEEMEVVPVEGKEDTYFAKLTKLGAIAITCDK